MGTTMKRHVVGIEAGGEDRFADITWAVVVLRQLRGAVFGGWVKNV